MAETQRVVVTRSFYTGGGKIAKVGDALELRVDQAEALKAIGKVADAPDADLSKEDKQVIKDESEAQVREDKRTAEPEK